MVAWLGLGGCTAPGGDKEDLALPYNLSQPERVIKLSGSLEEISGITALDDNTLLAVQDERGVLYRLDLAGEKITERHRFRPSGDYEDVAWGGGDTVFVLESSGNLHQVFLGAGGDTAACSSWFSGLEAGYDTEGLAYDAERRRLLLAAKKSPLPKKLAVRGRDVFGYDLERQKLELLFPISAQEIERYLERCPDRSRSRAVRSRLDALKQPLFEPSGLAIHPVSGQYYLVSGTSNLLMVVDVTGLILCMEALPEDLFEQPEGIAFLPSGDLILASEGVKRKARLVRYVYAPSSVQK